jgi:hypothetical protein
LFCSAATSWTGDPGVERWSAAKMKRKTISRQDAKTPRKRREAKNFGRKEFLI